MGIVCKFVISYRFCNYQRVFFDMSSVFEVDAAFYTRKLTWCGVFSKLLSLLKVIVN